MATKLNNVNKALKKSPTPKKQYKRKPKKIKAPPKQTDPSVHPVAAGDVVSSPALPQEQSSYKYTILPGGRPRSPILFWSLVALVIFCLIFFLLPSAPQQPQLPNTDNWKEPVVSSAVTPTPKEERDVQEHVRQIFEINNKKESFVIFRELPESPEHVVLYLTTKDGRRYIARWQDTEMP